MDINARINWKPGMEVTAETFLGMNRHIDFQQQTAIRAALGNTLIGLLPDSEFNNEGSFVRNTFEIPNFRCTALLPSGRIIDANERAVVNIPMLYGSQYFLTVTISDEQTEFEKEGVAYVRPQYVYGIHALEEIDGKDYMPVARFKVQDGVFSLDDNYIPPTLEPVCDPRFKEWQEKMAGRLESMANHKNMADEFGKRALLHYLFVMKSYNLKNTTSHFIGFTQEIAHAISYYVGQVAPGMPQELPTPTPYDMEAWLQWLDNYMAGAISLLDGVVLEDNSIDFDALKAEIKSELYEQMIPELHDRLKEELRTELSDELKTLLMETTKAYIDDTLKPMLHDQLKEELTDEMYQSLYDALYKALYDALYVPTEKEEDTFMPLI